MTSAYDKDLRKLTMDTARELGMSDFIREGVYIHLAGPSYETPAESRFLRMIGADSVGMSTAPEVVVARHCGIRVLGKSREEGGRGCFHINGTCWDTPTQVSPSSPTW